MPGVVELIEALVTLDGNMHLLAENYNTSVGELYAALATDEAMALLKARIEAKTLVTSFRMLSLTTQEVEKAIPALEDKDLIRLHTGLLSSIGETVKKPSAGISNQNNMQVIFNNLPADVQAALAVLNPDGTMTEQQVLDAVAVDINKDELANNDDE